MPHPILIPDIAFLVAPQCDWNTLRSLAMSCEYLGALFGHHQRSVVKTWIDNYNLKTGRGSMLSPLNWSGTILDTISTASRLSATSESILPPFSFRVVRELDSRKRRIDALFGYQADYGDGGGGGLTLLQDVIRHTWKTAGLADHNMARFVNGLKRACVFVDTMVDCAAGIYLEDQHQEQQTQKLRGDEKELKKEEGALASVETTMAVPTQQQRARKAHWAMRRYILSLTNSRGLSGVEDLTYLYVLVHRILPAALLRSDLLLERRHQPAQSDADADDSRVDMVLAMQEVFLRHGSVALQGRFLKGDSEGDMRTSLPSSSEPSTTGSGTHSSPDPKSTIAHVVEPTQPSTTDESSMIVDGFSPGGLLRWLSNVTDQVVDEIKAYENGWATQAEDAEDDDGTGVLPGLASALYKAVRELFSTSASTGDSPGAGVDNSTASVSGDDDEYDKSNGKSGKEVRDWHLNEFVKRFVDVGT